MILKQEIANIAKELRLLPTTMWNNSPACTFPSNYLAAKKTSNQLLYAQESTKGLDETNNIKAYKINEIEGATVTEQTFYPKYAVEL